MSKENLVLHLKAVNELSKINLATIRVRVSAEFEKHSFCFSITIFDKHLDNFCFYFDHFQNLDKAKERLVKIIEKIKLDDFAKLKQLRAEIGS